VRHYTVWPGASLATLIVALLAGPAACSGPQPQPAAAPATRIPKTVASSLEVMKTMTIPFSETVFKAASEPPADDAAWSNVREHAVALAETGNLLLIGSRVREGTWTTLAAAQVDAAVDAATAASEKNADKLAMASDRLYGTCENCHQIYLK
jgi:cytochrome c556